MKKNPALFQVPRNQPAALIPVQRDASILDWLEQTGRLISREATGFEYKDDEEEINELMGNEDNNDSFDDDDDDSLELDD
jgi:phosphopantothenoylcysteine synthetase/decarboxylase